ncbi:YsnF/AvaK domain-containing protein [Spirosoma agri]|uniref:YsnF/AvaK domain-containing protein n=1 Tax=Spirosoma agri TaxID=1987381 RepID=A0A6M0IP65_9BACT|nr:YsnF/AvaK domain-containing protein [Spirosoma agri]NEU70119.1 YsnF/AvaK domain-containing protein [Spirosoma agri]
MIPQESFTTSSTSAQSPQPDGDASDQPVVTNQPVERIPVIEETITIGKRLVETGQVRLVKTVHQDQQEVQIPLTADQIMVERVLINELVDEAPVTRQEGDTIIYPVLKEEYVLVKRIRLVEEIRVTTRQVQTIENQTINLRREEIAIERTSIESRHERSDSTGASTTAAGIGMGGHTEPYRPDESSL